MIPSWLREAASLPEERRADVGSLYQSWWSSASGGGAGDARRRGDAGAEAYFPPRRLLAAADGPDMVVYTGLGVDVARAGEWVSASGDFVQVIRRSEWTEAEFSWRQASCLMPVTALRWRIRIYLPSAVGFENRELFQLVCRQLDASRRWYVAKTRLASGAFRDAVVVWVSAGDAPFVVDLLRDPVSEIAFTCGPPPATFARGGIGIARDPDGGESFGWELSRAVLHWLSVDTTGEDLITWQEAAIDRGFDAAAPWRHVGVDPHGVWSRIAA
jgi:hypothetical protein